MNRLTSPQKIRLLTRSYNMGTIPPRNPQTSSSMSTKIKEKWNEQEWYVKFAALGVLAGSTWYAYEQYNEDAKRKTAETARETARRLDQTADDAAASVAPPTQQNVDKRWKK